MHKLIGILFLALLVFVIVFAVHILSLDVSPAFKKHADDSVSNTYCCIIQRHAANYPATDQTSIQIIPS